jgi:hypothetical protein
MVSGRGHGLFADRDYHPGEVITTYGGRLVYGQHVQGDYVAYCGNNTNSDGSDGFQLSEKGRWINESDRDRTIVNATLGRTIRAQHHVKQGQEIFVDYGEQYQRSY